jgi:ABC-type phosphate/phosphonate transport system ATPase subunit
MRLEAVGKRYGVRQPWVVRGVTADLPAGRLIRVAGRNASGKSTLLRVVAGVSAPSAGKVTGARWRDHSGRQDGRARKEVGSGRVEFPQTEEYSSVCGQSTDAVSLADPAVSTAGRDPGTAAWRP